MMVAAAHVDAVEAEQLRAPQRARRAEKCLTGKPGVTVTSTVLEGNPAEVILDEAERWKADLVVVGSHGYGPVKRRVHRCRTRLRFMPHARSRSCAVPTRPRDA
jgi:nucleotide-binding universal stress UspA family protein